MKYLKKFNESKVPSKTDKDFVHSDLFHNIIRYGIYNKYTINPDGSIDVDNNVSFTHMRSSDRFTTQLSNNIGLKWIKASLFHLLKNY